jgi:hypothetical protein
MTAVRGYAHFLKTTATIIHDPQYFPQAKIITFGIAHSSDRWDRPPHHFSNPARMVALLWNLDGFNYLDNASYHIDGYGTHIYPWDVNNLESAMDIIRQDASILGTDKPFWITEWGLPANKYPNKKGETRGDGIKDFYAAMVGRKYHLAPRSTTPMTCSSMQTARSYRMPVRSPPVPVNINASSNTLDVLCPW